MPRQIITTAHAPSSPLFSQGIKAGPHVLVSGIVGIDPGTGHLAGNIIQDQTRQALANCEAILRAGGASLDDVIEVGVLLTRPRRLRRPERGIRAVVSIRAADPLRRQARRGSARTAGLNSDDSIHRLTHQPGLADHARSLFARGRVISRRGPATSRVTGQQPGTGGGLIRLGDPVTESRTLAGRVILCAPCPLACLTRISLVLAAFSHAPSRATMWLAPQLEAGWRQKQWRGLRCAARARAVIWSRALPVREPSGS